MSQSVENIRLIRDNVGLNWRHSTVTTVSF